MNYEKWFQPKLWKTQKHFRKSFEIIFGENLHCKFPTVLTAIMATPTAEYFEKLLSALLSIIPVISGLISGISGLDNGKLELLHQWMIDVLKTTSKSYPGPDYVFLIFSLNSLRFFFSHKRNCHKHKKSWAIFQNFNCWMIKLIKTPILPNFQVLFLV